MRDLCHVTYVSIDAQLVICETFFRLNQKGERQRVKLSLNELKRKIKNNEKKRETGH